MSPEQLITLGNHIRANTDQRVIDAIGSNDWGVIASIYCEPTDLTAWKRSVTVDEIDNATDWAEYMAVPSNVPDTIAGLKSVMLQNTAYARQNAALARILTNHDVDTSSQKIRDALSVIFEGDANTRDAILAIAKELMNRVESVFASGPIQGAYVRSFYGSVTWSDCKSAYEATA